MSIDTEVFDTSKAHEPSTHASVTLISAAGTRLAQMVMRVENIEKVIGHYQKKSAVEAIQVYIRKSKLIGTKQCVFNEGAAHHLWRDRLITCYRTPTRAWSRVDSCELEDGCEHVLQGEDIFLAFEDQIRQQHEAQQHQMQQTASIFSALVQPGAEPDDGAPDDGALN